MTARHVKSSVKSPHLENYHRHLNEHTNQLAEAAKRTRHEELHHQQEKEKEEDESTDRKSSIPHKDLDRNQEYLKYRPTPRPSSAMIHQHDRHHKPPHIPQHYNADVQLDEISTLASNESKVVLVVTIGRIKVLVIGYTKHRTTIVNGREGLMKSTHE